MLEVQTKSESGTVVVFEFVLIIVFVSVVITDLLRFIHRHLTVVIVPSSFPPINNKIRSYQV